MSLATFDQLTGTRDEPSSAVSIAREMGPSKAGVANLSSPGDADCAVNPTFSATSSMALSVIVIRVRDESTSDASSSAKAPAEACRRTSKGLAGVG